MKLKSLDEGLESNHPTMIEVTIRSIVRLVIIYYIFKTINFFFAVTLIVILINLYNYLVGKIFRIDYLNPIDKVFVNVDDKWNMNIGLMFKLDNFNVNKVKNSLIDKLFKRMPKLSASLRVKFGEYCWNTPRIEQISMKEREEIYLKRIIEVTLTEDNLMEYVEKEANKLCDSFKMPIECHLITIKDKSYGYIYTKKDHALCDGLGGIALLGYLDDDFDLNKYPKIIRQEMTITQKILFTLKDCFNAIVFGLVQSALLTIAFFSEKVTYKKFSKPVKHYGKIKILQNYDLNEIKKVCYKLQLTINELYNGIIFCAFKKLSPESTHIALGIPVGFTAFPKRFEDIEFYNNASMVFNKVNLINDVVIDKKIIASDLRKMVKSTYLARVTKFFMYLGLGVLPSRFSKIVASPQNIELVVSNVPRQEREIIIGGCPVKDITPIVASHLNKSFINISSYNGKIRYTLTVDSNQDITVDQLGEKMEEILLSILNKKNE